MSEVKFNGRTIKFRKWKVKDKKALDLCKTETEKRKVYVYGCLDNPNEPLDIEEYNYVLSHIRDYSMSTPLEFSVKCSCGEEFDVSLSASEIVTAVDANYDPIVVDDMVIELGNVRNQEMYEKIVLNSATMSERYISDFAMHITRINYNDVEYSDVIDFIENLDVDKYEVIFRKWDSQRFKCSFNHEVTCPKCKRKNVYNFEDMPDFFPSTWKI